MQSAQILLLLATILVVCHEYAFAGKCKPVNLVMTRADSSAGAVRSDGTWDARFDLTTVNLANLDGALKYVLTETIDNKTGYSEETCQRKNNVNYIHFYNVTFCNPDAALWWFNPSRPASYGPENEGFELLEYGQYIAMDGGQCRDNPYCDYIYGIDNKLPKLGPWVGFQDNSKDPRNPIASAAWFHFIAECPLQKWADKSNTCIAENPTGRCASGVVPDGDNCTWSYNYFGNVNLDDLVGITSQKNKNGTFFKSHVDFCKEGNLEFLRNETTNEMIDGLKFWKGPLNKIDNNRRLTSLLEMFNNKTLYPNNTAIPSASSLRLTNPACYETVRLCGDGSDGTRLCMRDDSMICVYCEKGENGCNAPPSDWKDNRMIELPTVFLPLGSNTPENNSGGDDGSNSAGVLSISSFALILSSYLFMLIVS